MTEEEWLTCDSPSRMVEFLKGTASERKWRLFTISCARLVWERMSDPEMRRAVEAAEGSVEGSSSPEEQGRAHVALYSMLPNHDLAGAMGVSFKVLSSLHGLALCCGFSSRGLERLATMNSWRAGRLLTADHQPGLLREILGNPFRPAVRDPAWLAWNGGIIPTLARAVYEEREMPSGHLDTFRLALLADMLEDAGCTNAQILDHLRGGGPHVRGCWVVDLLLGKT